MYAAMRTHIEFRSSAFPACPSEHEEVNPGRYGKRLAEFLSARLPEHGFAIARLGPEDWGWRVDLENEAFPLWIGCGNYEEYDDGFLCFIEPSRPYIQKFFKRISTTEQVERLSLALDAIVRGSDEVTDARWWSESEVLQG